MSDKPKKTRSVKLRKYEFAYQSCIRKQETRKKSPRPQRKPIKKKQKDNISPPKKISCTPLKDTSEKTKKRPLTGYQKFVRSESKKEIYKNMNGKDRLQAISKRWAEEKKIVSNF